MIPIDGRIIILREQWPMLIDIDGNHWHYYSLLSWEQFRACREETCYLCKRGVSMSGYQEATTRVFVCDGCVDRSRSSIHLAPRDTGVYTDVSPYFMRNWSLNPHMRARESYDRKFIIRWPGI